MLLVYQATPTFVDTTNEARRASIEVLLYAWVQLEDPRAGVTSKYREPPLYIPLKTSLTALSTQRSFSTL